LLLLLTIFPATRILANLRQTTRECVDSVMRGHFRSSDENNDHTIPYQPKPHTREVHGSIFYKQNRNYCPSKFLHCGNKKFRVFFASMTLILIWWPSYTRLNEYPQTKNELSTSRLSKLSYYIHTDRYTDRCRRN